MAENHNMLKVGSSTDNLKFIKSPSTMTWTLSDVSASSSGRTQDGVMHKERIGQKNKLELSWNNPSPSEIKSIISAFNPEYFYVEFDDPKTNSRKTKQFYRGDISAPVQEWSVNRKRYTQVSLNIIEV